MHNSSKIQMKNFVNKYLDETKKLSILDIGSYDVNGSYKDLFKKYNWKYVGIDITKGRNVDIVAKNIYNWGIDKKYDVVISGQCIEHVEDLKLWALELKKVVKPNGLICVIGPNNGFKEHRYPVDCWRIFPDGMKFLLNTVCGFKILECFFEGTDCVGIAKNVKG